MSGDAPGLEWHRDGMASVLPALPSLGLEGREDGSGLTPDGTKWKADVLFAARGRTIAVQLQRGYQPLREFRRRQARFAQCAIDGFWLFRPETFETLRANLQHTRDAGAIPELPVAVLHERRVETAASRNVSVAEWLAAVVEGAFHYRDGAWRLR